MDYHVFRSQFNLLMGVTFVNEEDFKNFLNNFFDTNSGVFGKKTLVVRWEEAANSNSNGEYIID